MGAIFGSVRVTGFIAPTDTADTYATQDEFYNRGGYRSIVNFAGLGFQITYDRRKLGMLVKDLTTGIIWTLTADPPPGLAPVWAIQNLATGTVKDTFRFNGNGHFPVDTQVDGAWIAPAAGTITAVWVDVDERGTDPAPGVPMDNIWDVKKNGITIFTVAANRPTIPTTPAGGQADAPSGVIDPLLAPFVLGDRLTVDTVQVANGATRPATFSLTILVVY